MVVKVNDYVRLRGERFVHYGWVDSIHDNGLVALQCDDAKGHGVRGIMVNKKSIAEVLPPKPRPLAWWKRELCKRCELYKDKVQCSLERVDRDCPFILELTMAGAVPI